jgi:phosphoglycolate phosphatase-like HAD superfamily hydrolase
VTVDNARPLLPSWRPGATRDAIVGFLEAATSLPVASRVAAFDNDGTLWCERPNYLQLDFFIDGLRSAADSDPTLAERAEYAAILNGDRAAIGEIGLTRVAGALAELFAGLEPAEFAGRARSFVERARHPLLDLPAARTVYQPMLELLDELRRREFAVFIVSGGGTEFLRSVSDDLYGVAPESVVGTLIEYEFTRSDDGRPVLRRTARMSGEANEGPAKVTHIQTQLGRRPILGAGNSSGDREMLEWATAGDGPTIALVIDHDDDQREFAYQGTAESFAESEPIARTAERLDWTVVSMKNDWLTVFPS